VVMYLILSINTYLETHAFGVFTLGYGLLGPTEARVLLVIMNTVIALGIGVGVDVAGLGLSLLDAAGIVIVAAMIVGLVGRAGRNLRKLAELEPA
jgi:archaetidylinositol phosphate synthase